MSFPRPKGNRFRRAPARALILAAVGVVWASGGDASAADIYRSVGADGVISFSTKKQSGSKLYSRGRSNPARMPGDDSPERFSRYDLHIREAATLYQIPAELVRAVIRVESDFDPRAISPKNARGLMQMIPATAERMMVTDAFDPRENIFGGTRYLRVLANLFNGDIELTVAAYNAGEGAVMRYGGIPPYAETQDYVTRVLALYRQYRSH
jgi:soluble lytic murein transglycosylase-like protein